MSDGAAALQRRRRVKHRDCGSPAGGSGWARAIRLRRRRCHWHICGSRPAGATAIQVAGGKLPATVTAR